MITMSYLNLWDKTWTQWSIILAARMRELHSLQLCRIVASMEPSKCIDRELAFSDFLSFRDASALVANGRGDNKDGGMIEKMKESDKNDHV